ncbi:hypothetical protein F5883DRAFT_536643 [Diaporthe sp. PMI_573]|jgi:hypothetical protein|nr:hypothetical protein F5883DRAFT_536643 [Diaporthaceae sp. PMI_573]
MLCGSKGGGVRDWRAHINLDPRTAGRLAFRPVPALLFVFSFSFFPSSNAGPPLFGLLELYFGKDRHLTKSPGDGCPRPVMPVNRLADEPRSCSTNAACCVPVSRDRADLAGPATARTPAGGDRPASLVTPIRQREAEPATSYTGRPVCSVQCAVCPCWQQWLQRRGLCLSGDCPVDFMSRLGEEHRHSALLLTTRGRKCLVRAFRFPGNMFLANMVAPTEFGWASKQP